MKRIIMDFLRRWWLVYPMGAFFVGVFAIGLEMMGVEMYASFLVVAFFMLPFAFELGRRPVGVMAALPVSRRTIALSYWSVAVVLPVILMAGTMALVGLFFPLVAPSAKNVALFLFGSLVFAGSSFCLLTFILPEERGSDPDIVMMKSSWALGLPAFVFGIFAQELPGMTTQGPLAYFWGLLGLVLTVWGYMRSEKLIAGRARKVRDGGPFRTQTPTPPFRSQTPIRIPAFKPGMARFGGVFFDVVWRGFLFGLAFPALLLLFETHNSEDKQFWPFLFVFGGMGSAGVLLGGVRLLRSVPLSVGQLALNLLLMPLFSILAAIAGVAVIQWLNLGHFLSRDSATFLIPMTGAICFASSLMVPYSGRGNGYLIGIGLGMPAAWVVFDTVADANWPAVFWWLLGLCLMAAAFFLNRHWLRSSASYRPSTGDFLRRQR